MCGKNIWVFIERNDGHFEEASLEALAKGREIASRLSEKMTAIVLGNMQPDVRSFLCRCGADRAVFVQCDDTSVESRVEGLCALATAERPRLMLFGATLYGNDLACRLAAALEVTVVTDCSNISSGTDGPPIYSKTTHGGRVASDYVCRTEGCHLVTILSGSGEKAKPDEQKGDEAALTFRPNASRRIPRIRSLEHVPVEPGEMSLEEAEVVVCGGRGMNSKEGFRVLETVADLLNGVVGASLAAIDDGLAPRSRLVGQTGATVTPRLYVAFGISGSVYHALGMKNAKAIVAVNNDYHAEIFKYADLGLVSDATDVAREIARILDAAANDEGYEP